jgi:uncharacterized protein YhhL (DUF1145 family)
MIFWVIMEFNVVIPFPFGVNMAQFLMTLSVAELHSFERKDSRSW